jgi:outer membrane immunogenic protein
MYRKSFQASLCAFVLTGSAAFAADFGYPPPPAYLPPPLFTWSGIFVGGQLGYVWAAGAFNESGFDPLTGAVINGTINGTPSGVIGGAHIGYQYQFNQLVLGVQGSLDGTSLTNTAVATFPLAFGGSNLSAQTTGDVRGSIRGKFGIALDRALIYGTAGVSFGGFKTALSLTAPNTPIFATATTSSTRTGWTAGGGVEYAVTNNWWIFAEYRFTDFGTLQSNFLATDLPTGAFINGERHLQENQVQAGFSYRFDIYAPVPVVAKY